MLIICMKRLAAARLLSEKEWKKRFGDKDYFQKSVFPSKGMRYGSRGSKVGLGTFEIDSRFFGVLAEPAYTGEIFLPDEKLLCAFVSELNAAVQRLNEIVPSSRLEFPVRIQTSQSNMSTFSGYLIDIGDCYVKDLSASFDRGDYKEVSTCIQSEYFHELIHDRRRDRADEDMLELLPLLGEFLYDPTSNEYRNKVFQKLGHEVMESYLKNTLLTEQNRYIEAWAVISQLLLFEYSRLDNAFTVPSVFEERMALIIGLPELYKTVSQEKRDEILRKYLDRPCEELEVLFSFSSFWDLGN